MVNEAVYGREEKREVLRKLGEDVVPDRGNDSTGGNDPTKPSNPARSPNQPAGFKKIGLAFGIVAVVALLIGGVWFAYGNYLISPPAAYIGPLPELRSNLYVSSKLPQPGLRCELPDIPENLTAKSIAITSADSFNTLQSKNAEKERPFASIVKLLGGLVVVEHYDLSEEIALLQEVDAKGNGIDLEVGEKVTVYDLLGAALIGSKNDAMYALAQNYPGGTKAFVARMNERAQEIGLTNTSIQNPIGLDHSLQYSTATDISLLIIAAMRNETIANLLSLPRITITTSSGRQETIWTTNSLLGKTPGVIAGKTGFTADAGLSLVTYIDSDPDFVVVVLNSEDRFEETAELVYLTLVGMKCQ